MNNYGLHYITFGEYMAPEGKFSKRIERVRGIPRTERSLRDYETSFGTDIGEDPGIVLDIGAGDATFANEVRLWDEKQATVIATDPSYVFAPPKNKFNVVVDAPAVAAFMDELPFAENSIDRVVASFVFVHMRRDHAARSVTELLRVIKPGGLLQIHAALIHTALPADYSAVIARKYSDDKPTLEITKPDDYDAWGKEEKMNLGDYVAEKVSFSRPLLFASNAIWRAMRARRQYDS